MHAGTPRSQPRFHRDMQAPPLRNTRSDRHRRVDYTAPWPPAATAVMAASAVAGVRDVAAHREPQDAVQRVLVRLVLLLEVQLQRLPRPVQRPPRELRDRLVHLV